MEMIVAVILAELESSGKIELDDLAARIGCTEDFIKENIPEI